MATRKQKRPGKAAPKKRTSAKRPAPKKAKAKPKAKAKAKAKAKPKATAKAKPKAKAKRALAAKPKKATKPVAPRPTPARDARQALAIKKAISEALSPAPEGKAVVDAYFRDIDHPFKAEMEAVRAIVLGASPKISERIKWNAPSFFYKEDLGAFHPRATEFAHLILLFPGGAGMQDDSGLLEGQHKDRREAKFHSLDDVKAKKRALEKLVKSWVELRDR